MTEIISPVSATLTAEAAAGIVPLATTAVMQRAELCPGGSIGRCDDCPEVNPRPPSSSECSDFSTAQNGEPMCSKPDPFHRAFAEVVRTTSVGADGLSTDTG